MNRTSLLIILMLGSIACAPAPEVSQETVSEPTAEGLENGSFHADLNGFQIHYEVHGQGPVVMIVPNSWGLTLDGLRALYRPLEKHLTLVYFDPRGMGESDDAREDTDLSMAAVRADFDALRRHLGQDKVHALGWSNGAINLIQLAAEKPETLHSAIFLHGGSKFDDEDQQRLSAERPELIQAFADFFPEIQAAEADGESREELDERVKNFIIEEWFVLLMVDAENGAETLRELYMDTSFSWQHLQYGNSENAGGYDFGDLLPSIPIPSLVIAGAHDLLPPSNAELLHQGLPDSRFEVFEDSAHYAPIEEPERFRTTVLEFLGVAH